MNWSNLKDSCCPQCGNKLESQGLLEVMLYCSRCPYKISEKRFEEILSDMFKPKKKYVQKDNLADLNNLGHKKVAEDFSDSNFI